MSCFLSVGETLECIWVYLLNSHSETSRVFEVGSLPCGLLISVLMKSEISLAAFSLAAVSLFFSKSKISHLLTRRFNIALRPERTCTRWHRQPGQSPGLSVFMASLGPRIRTPEGTGSGPGCVVCSFVLPGSTPERRAGTPVARRVAQPRIRYP